MSPAHLMAAAIGVKKISGLVHVAPWQSRILG